MQPKTAWDWFTIFCLWIGAAVFAINQARLPLMSGAPAFLASGVWNFVPLVLLTLALGVFIVRALRSGAPQPQSQDQALEIVADVAEPVAAPVSEPPRSKLTIAEREAVGEILDRLLRFVRDTLEPFLREIGRAQTSEASSCMGQLEKISVARAMQITGEVHKIQRQDEHYLRIIDLDLAPLVRAVEGAEFGMEQVLRAKGWNYEPQADKISAFNQPISDLGGAIGNLKQAILQKRQEYLAA